MSGDAAEFRPHFPEGSISCCSTPLHPVVAPPASLTGISVQLPVKLSRTS